MNAMTAMHARQFARGRSAALMLTLVAALTACSKAPPPAEPPRSVLTQVVGAALSEAGTTYSGEIRSQHESQLAFRVPGKITSRLVDTGAHVRAGEILAKLDPADLALNAAAANAQYALAEADVQRFRELRGKNFVSQSALDAKETAYRAAQAQADLARNQNTYAVLRAEQAGVVAQVLAEAGQVVAAGQPVFRLARADAPEVAINIPESRMREIRPGMPAEVTLWADEAARYVGEVRELATVADPQTRTYAARVKIKAPDARLLLGMSASVRLVQAASPQPASLNVPLTAIFQQDGKPAAWVVGEDQTLTLRPIGVRSFGEHEAQLEVGEHAGLKAGERIVVAGVHKLRAGEKIKAVDRLTAPAK